MLTQTVSDVQLRLLQHLIKSRAETDRLFDMLTPDVLYSRPIPERHRVVFYIGHLEAFDWNLLSKHLGLDPFNCQYDRLFAFGIDPVGGNLPSDRPVDWPAMQDVEAYRTRVRYLLDSALTSATENNELTQLLNIAIEHRLMHAETLEYMFHQLPYDSKRNDVATPPLAAPPVTPEMVQIPAGLAILGLPRQPYRFGWDNEFESHTVMVPSFKIDKYKVTNGQFLMFIDDNGYQRRELWSDEDWEWKTKAEISHPVFWVSSAAGFRYRGMFAETDLNMDAPVYTSYAEACAYSRWAGKQLPTEEEWIRSARGAQPPHEARILWNPPPVGLDKELASDYGVEGLLGTGWEWTSTPFAPFPGFQITPEYPGYSAPFFDGKHFVMKGGSPRTAAAMMRMSFRNWFQPHYQYVYAGFRCVSR